MKPYWFTSRHAILAAALGLSLACNGDDAGDMTTMAASTTGTGPGDGSSSSPATSDSSGAPDMSDAEDSGTSDAFP